MLRYAQLVMQDVHMVTNTYAATVAANVNRAIRARGVTVVELSETSLIPRSTLTRRLSGASPFTVAELDQIAAALNMPVASLSAPSTANVAA
jgi:predicted transcriptional regulator